jgi:tetratricopeptide (TPR) repeat protein
VRRFCFSIGGAVAAAILFAAAAPPAVRAQQQQPQQKQITNPQEYALYNTAVTAMRANDWAKALPALQEWKDKFPDSVYKDDRDFYILRAYLASQQFDKALTFGDEFIGRDLPTMFKDNLSNVIGSYFIVTNAAAQLINKNATPEQIAIGDKAAHKLLDYAPTYFVAANMPAGQTAQTFDQTKQQMMAVANGFLLTEAVQPGVQAEAKKDCPGADAAFSKALTAYPDNTWISAHLSRAYNCEDKPFLAMYELARTAAVDPTQGKTSDGPKFLAYVKKTYVTLHGSDEGFDQLMEQAKATPIPAADFKIKTADEIKADAANAFAQANPEIARWQGIKTNLASQGDAFFQSMKGAEIPTILATIAEAKPACRPKELILYVPSPDNAAKTNEITLKFETAISGKPEIGSNIKFEAVADSWTPTPFMLTMTADKDKVHDLQTSPCTPAVVHKKKD